MGIPPPGTIVYFHLTFLKHVIYKLAQQSTSISMGKKKKNSPILNSIFNDEVLPVALQKKLCGNVLCKKEADSLLKLLLPQHPVSRWVN